MSGTQPLLSRGVLGVLFRQRNRCTQCLAVSDQLVWDYLVRVNLEQGRHEDEPITLRELWEEHWKEVQPPGCRCPLEQCGRPGMQQFFLEVEPNVLIIQIKRGKRDCIREPDRNGVMQVVSQREYKICRPVQFPQRLNFLRSGPYELACIVQHLGRTTQSGH